LTSYQTLKNKALHAIHKPRKISWPQETFGALENKSSAREPSFEASSHSLWALGDAMKRRDWNNQQAIDGHSIHQEIHSLTLENIMTAC
jgi:hypothetical protein